MSLTVKNYDLWNFQIASDPLVGWIVALADFRKTKIWPVAGWAKLYPSLGADIFDSEPKPANAGPKLTKNLPRPAQTGPKPAQHQPKPVENLRKNKIFESGRIYPSWGRI